MTPAVFHPDGDQPLPVPAVALTGDAAAAIDAAASLAPPLERRCANCGAVLTGPFCADCGQHALDLHHSVWRFVSDFFDSVLCWDNKLLRTLGPLFRQPGFLTREYLAGRRVRYVHPLRLFLFTSAICLTLLQFSHDHLVKPGAHHDALSGDDSDFRWVDKDKPTASATKGNAPPPAASAHPDGAPENGLEAQIGRDYENKISRYGGDEAALNKTLSDHVERRLSWVALGLLPVFALGLRALYWRKDAFYFAHLVFSLHYHTFLLLFWTAYVGLGIVAAHLLFGSALGLILKLSLLLPPCYLFLALRRMYGEGWSRTLIKTLALGSTHLFVILLSLLLMAGGSYLFL